VLSIACCSLLLGTPAMAQMKVNLPKGTAVAPNDAQSMQERMNHLEATVKTLQAQLAADEKKLQEASDAAGQAKAGVGIINMGFGKQIADLKSAVDKNMATTSQTMNNTNGVIAGIGQKLDALANRFALHTHDYHMPQVILDSDHTVKNLSYIKQTSEPPNK
jgi:hypothetical protein